MASRDKQRDWSRLTSFHTTIITRQLVVPTPHSLSAATAISRRTRRVARTFTKRASYPRHDKIKSATTTRKRQAQCEGIGAPIPIFGMSSASFPVFLFLLESYLPGHKVKRANPVCPASKPRYKIPHHICRKPNTLRDRRNATRRQRQHNRDTGTECAQTLPLASRILVGMWRYECLRASDHVDERRPMTRPCAFSV